MKPRQQKFNPKRRFLRGSDLDRRRPVLLELAERVTYGGNPEHKRAAGDFGLTPPAAPRAAKSLCDDASITRRRDALELLRSGFRRGLVSDRFEGPWPYNVWAVTADGVPLEAQLESEGVYHGYPMPDADPLAVEIRKRWRELANG